MIFLNPAILLGLLAAALPILIHLLNLRQRKRMEFSSLMLVKQIETSSLNRFKIRQWLLLLLRSLIVFLLVAAFSKPIFPSMLAGSGFATQNKTSAAILFDVSPSMQYRDSFGNDQFKQAKAAALRLLDFFSENDEIFLLPSHHWVEPVPLSVSEAKKRIVQFSPEAFGLPIEAGIDKASEILASAAHLNRELYVVSDFQASGYFAADTLKKRNEKIQLYLINIAPKERRNAALTDAQVVTKILEPRKPIRFSLAATQRPASSTEIELALILDKKTAAQNALQFGDGESAQQTLSATPTRNGFISGYAEIPKDNLEMDDVRYLAFHIPEKLRLLVAYRNLADIFFLKLALESFFEGNFFELVFAPESTLDSRNFETFDALIFCGVSTLSPTTIQKTVAYIENGGGLLYFTPISSPFADVNRLLRTMGLGEVRANPLNVPTAIDFIDTRHPMLDGVFASTAKLKSQLQAAPNTLGEAFRVNEYLKSPIESRIVGFQNGKSFLTVARFGNGNVMVSPTLPTKDAASLVLQPIFPPLLFRAVFSIARSTQSQTLSFVAGESGALALPPTYSIKNELTVEKPSGKTLSPIVQRKGNEWRIILSPKLYDELGIYRVMQSNGEETRLILEFAMNLAPKESDLNSLSLEAAKNRLVQSGFDENAVFLADASEKIEAVADLISNSRFGFGIWKYLLALAVALLAFESVLGRKTEV